jgi:hypothetical protein
MKADSIREFFRPYSIVGSRRTTINHTFASAIALVGEISPTSISRAVRALGQNPDSDLTCVYCGKEAQTWDHVFALVENGEYSGYGHTLGNLVPCCKQCNSQKGNQNWERFLRSRQLDGTSLLERTQKIAAYIEKEMPRRVTNEDIRKLCPAEMEELERAKNEVIHQMEKADKVATLIRQKVKNHLKDDQQFQSRV